MIHTDRVSAVRRGLVVWLLDSEDGAFREDGLWRHAWVEVVNRESVDVAFLVFDDVLRGDMA